jgi:hypothetical protein
MKRSKKLIYGCVVASVTLLLCIPAMAGGYSAKSELKINIIGLHPCSGEQELMEEMFLLEQEKEPELSEDELPKATPSNATKSNASSTKKYLPNKNLQGKKKNTASLSDAKVSDAEWFKEKEVEEIYQASASNAGLQGF